MQPWTMHITSPLRTLIVIAAMQALTLAVILLIQRSRHIDKTKQNSGNSTISETFQKPNGSTIWKALFLYHEVVDYKEIGIQKIPDSPTRLVAGHEECLFWSSISMNIYKEDKCKWNSTTYLKWSFALRLISD